MKTWKIRGLALAACLAFVTTACESKNDDVADRRPTATVAVTGADGRDADNGGVSYGADDAASETAHKSEARESNRRDASDNEGSDRKSDKIDKSHKKGESEQKDKSDKKGDSEREGESGQKDKSDKREGGKAGPGSSERSASGNYYFDDDDDEIVTPDGTLIGEDDPVTVVKAPNGVARISSSGGIVRVEGDVKEIVVYGSDVVADSAAKVRILGSDVDVFVRSVSSVRFDGSDNDVRWTDGPMPSATDNGAENEIRRARPAPAR